MVDPRDFFAVEDIQLRTGFEVQPYLALPGDIDTLLDTAYGVTTKAADVAEVQRGRHHQGCGGLGRRGFFR